jgi:hypothetical protein
MLEKHVVVNKYSSNRVGVFKYTRTYLSKRGNGLVSLKGRKDIVRIRLWFGIVICNLIQGHNFSLMRKHHKQENR